MITPETAKKLLEALRFLTDRILIAWPTLTNSMPVREARAAIKQAEEEIND